MIKGVLLHQVNSEILNSSFNFLNKEKVMKKTLLLSVMVMVGVGFCNITESSQFQVHETTWAGRTVLGQLAPDGNYTFFVGTNRAMGSMLSSVTMPLSEAIYFH